MEFTLINTVKLNWAKLAAYKASRLYTYRVVSAIATRALFLNVGGWSSL